MDFRLDWKNNRAGVLKMAAVGLLVLLLISVGITLIQTPTFPLRQSQLGGFGLSAPSIGGMYEKAADMMYAEDGVALSTRNIAPMPPVMPGTPGSDAEQFEVTQYTANIETRDHAKTCGVITALKSRADVIFENANEHDKGCDFTFKVTREAAGEVLAIIQSLDPKDLSENVYTIKNQIEDFTSEEEILKRKQQSIEATLEDAISAYDELTSLATSARDVETLAKIIDSKIRTIEQLTQQRISISEQLDRLSRAKAQQLDRLEYTYFYVSVYENKFVDGEQIKDSWKAAVKDAIRQVNEVVQDVSVTLIALLFLAAQYILYGIILLFIAKYAWKLTKTIWNK